MKNLSELFTGERDTTKTAGDMQSKFFRQKEGDIFLKHNESPESTALTIRNNEVAVHTGGGKTGVLIQENGKIIIQGVIKYKAESRDISRYAFNQEVTENPQSTQDRTMFNGSKVTGVSFGPLPHVHDIRDHDHELVPGYLRKMPDLSLLSQVEGFFEQFMSI